MTRQNRTAVLLALCFCLTVLVTSAAAQIVMTPDRKAFADAMKIKEPDKKAEALEKFLTDYPKSSAVFQAHQAVFETLVKNSPDQKEKILAHAHQAVEKADEMMRPYLYGSLASKLFEAGILLDEAEKLTLKGLAVTEEDLAKQRKQRLASSYATLGRIHLKQGKLKDAEKDLKQAYEYNPKLSSVLLGLGELYLKQGNEKQALESYSTAAVSGLLSAEARRQLDTLYSKSHGGSLKGLDEMLDTKYRSLFPSPVKVEHYTPSAKRGNRTVLAEVFTGSGCPPCVAADLGFDAMMDRYKRDDLAVVMYHLHIPAPDPMTNPATQARSKFYEVRGVPSYAVDGKSGGGGGSREMTQGFYDRVNPDVENRLEKPAEADLKLTAALEGTTVKAKAVVNNVKSESDKLRLHILLAEEQVRYNGENGIRFHPMVVRSLAGPDYGGFAVTAKDGQTFEWSFDLAAVSAEAKKHLDEYEKAGHRGEAFTFSEKKDRIDPNNLTLVAFVQDEKSKDVLQAVYLKVKPASVASAQKAEK